MRGGISYIAHRHGEANNKYVSNDDESKLSKDIMYLDANNLYGYALSQCLPTGGFRWLTDKQLSKVMKKNILPDSKKGYIFEVDLDYPVELHELHNDYPLAAEKLCVTKEMLSPYCKMLQEKFGITIGQVEKLIPTLSSKNKYLLHYRNLQLYLRLGMKLKQVYRVLDFDQSPWLDEYISFNTQKIINTPNSFEKYFFKLMNNGGKTYENIKHVDVRLVTTAGQLKKLVNRRTYVNSKIFNKNLAAVHKIKETQVLDKSAAYVGMCILDMSKRLMYDFHYNYIKSRNGKKGYVIIYRYR